MTVEMLRLGMRDLRAHWRTTLGMIAAVAIALMVFLALESITRGADLTFARRDSGNWIVQQRGALGEFSGSRLPGRYGQRLRGLGAEVAVPEIRSATGRSLADPTLVRGVPLAGYAGVERPRIVSGTPLRAGDRGLAMVGESLAERKAWTVGEAVHLRGRTFRIKGIFQLGTVADSELWLPLPEAQALLGFGRAVSIYVVRGDEALAKRIEMELPVEVTPEGEAFADLARSLDTTVRLLRAVSIVMGMAAALGILTVMFALVQRRVREIAILRTVGFGRLSLVWYVLGQAAAVTGTGFALSLATTALLLRGLRLSAVGVTITPVLDLRVAAAALGWSLALGLAAAAYPAVRAARLGIAEALRSE